NLQSQLQRNQEVKQGQEKMFLEGLRGDEGPYVDMRSPWKFDSSYKDKYDKRAAYSNGIQSSALRDPKERLIEQALVERRITLNVINRALDRVIDDVQALLGDINIVTDHAALENAGVHLDKPITTRFTDINLRSALDIILNDAGLTYIIKDQCIT